MVSSNCDFFVLWLDCDKEGENICFEVLDICKRNIPRSTRVQRVYRAKFSSIANKDIVAAFEGLRHGPNYNESISVDARQVLDLKIGVAFSRFQTLRLAGCIRKAGVRMLTYGPCQTPTLGFCVDQAEKIKKFVPEPYWRVEADIQGHGEREVHRVKWCRGKIFDKTAVQAIHQRLQNHYSSKEAEVINVKKEVLRQVRPQGLNTVKLLKVGSQSFGFSAFETMKVAEHLYLRGYTTYPRTESTTFSPNFNFKEVLSSLKDDHKFGDYTSELLKNGFQRPRQGVDAGDHPPITPVRAAAPGALHDRELRVYEYITSNFLACISKDATYQGIRADLLIGEETFKIKGQNIVESGFLEIQPW
jgi:DNA topoisomerase-3